MGEGRGTTAWLHGSCAPSCTPSHPLPHAPAHLHRDRAVKGGHFVAQLLQLAHRRGRQQVGPDGQRLQGRELAARVGRRGRDAERRVDGAVVAGGMQVGVAVPLRSQALKSKRCTRPHLAELDVGRAEGRHNLPQLDGAQHLVVLHLDGGDRGRFGRVFQRAGRVPAWGQDGPRSALCRLRRLRCDPSAFPQRTLPVRKSTSRPEKKLPAMLISCTMRRTTLTGRTSLAPAGVAGGERGKQARQLRVPGAQRRTGWGPTLPLQRAACHAAHAAPRRSSTRRPPAHAPLPHAPVGRDGVGVVHLRQRV